MAKKKCDPRHFGVCYLTIRDDIEKDNLKGQQKKKKKNIKLSEIF
jgi:hypothetical protein